MNWTSLTGEGFIRSPVSGIEIVKQICVALKCLQIFSAVLTDIFYAMFRESWRQMWDKAAEFLDNKIDVLVNNAGVSPKLGYDICMKVT